MKSSPKGGLFYLNEIQACLGIEVEIKKHTNAVCSFSFRLRSFIRNILRSEMNPVYIYPGATELLLIFLFIKYGEDWFAELENLPLFSKNKSYIVIWYFYITENLNERANNK